MSGCYYFTFISSIPFAFMYNYNKFNCFQVFILFLFCFVLLCFFLEIVLKGRLVPDYNLWLEHIQVEKGGGA